MLFQLCTTNIQVLKNLIDALKEIMIETNVQFSRNHVRIAKMNASGSICCIVNLTQQDLCDQDSNFYVCDYPDDKPLVVGINLLHLSKILRTIAATNTEITLYADDDNKNILKIIIRNELFQLVSRYSINFIEVNEEIMTFPDIEYDNVLQIDSKYLQRQIKDINNLHFKYIDLRSFQNELIIKATGGFMTQETVIGEVEESELTKNKKAKSLLKVVKVNPAKIIQGTFETKDLLLCSSKFTYLSPFFTLQFRNDTPLIIEIPVEHFGVITLGITLRTP